MSANDLYSAPSTKKTSATTTTANDLYGGNPTPAWATGKAAIHSTPEGIANTNRLFSGARSGGTKLLDLLQAPQRATLGAIGHSANPDVARENVRKALGINDRQALPGEDGFERGLDRLVYGATDAAIDAATDPLTYVGGLGLGTRAVEAFDRYGLPLANRAGDALNRLGKGGEAVTKLAADTHNVFSPDASFKRDLARTYGPEWIDQFSKAWGARNATQAQRTQINKVFGAQVHKIFEGLDDKQQLLMLRALDRGKIGNLAKRYPELVPRAEAFRTLTDSVAHLRGTKNLQKQLATNGFALPNYAKPFADRARGIQTTGQYRAHYVPKPHDFSEEAANDPKIHEMLANVHERKLGRVDLTKTASANLKRRRANPGISAVDLPDVRAAIDAFVGSAGNSIAGKDLQRRVASSFAPKSPLRLRAGAVTPEGVAKAAGDAGLSEADFAKLSPSIRALFARQHRPLTGSTTPQAARFKDVPHSVQQFFKSGPSVNDRIEAAQPILKAGREATNLGKGGLFYQPTPHMRNIATMQLLADPAALPDTIANWAKLGAGLNLPKRLAPNAESAADRKARQLADVIKAGSVGVENAESAATRRSFGDLAGHLSKVAAKVPGGAVAGKVAGAIAKPVEALYDTSGKMLWSFDDAAKAALTRRNAARYGSPERAAYEASRSLVDYNDASPATQALRYLFPFATWRTKMPIAVARSIVKNPQYAATLTRLDPRFAGASTPDASSPTGASTRTTPISEAFGSVQDPFGYLRGSLTTTGRLAGNVIANAYDRSKSGSHPPKRDANYFTYGRPAGKYAVSQIPYVGTLLDLAGHGLFPKAPGEALRESLTGVRPTKAPAYTLYDR